MSNVVRFHFPKQDEIMYMDKNTIIYKECEPDEYLKCWHKVKFFINNQIMIGRMPYKFIVKMFEVEQKVLPYHFIDKCKHYRYV